MLRKQLEEENKRGVYSDKKGKNGRKRQRFPRKSVSHIDSKTSVRKVIRGIGGLIKGRKEKRGKNRGEEAER